MIYTLANLVVTFNPYFSHHYNRQTCSVTEV